GARTVRALQKATRTVPIVFTSSADPVESGLVASFNRPGGNVTGVTMLAVALTAKRMELLRALLPKVSVVAALVNPASTSAAQDLQPAARTLGLELRKLRASTEDEIDASFRTLATHRVDALFVGSSPLFQYRRDRIVTLAARNAVPAIYDWRE